jgi:DNA-binding NarL/FixJ family response regulator
LSPQFSCDLVSVLAEAAKHPLSDHGPQLTRRQREVLQLVAEGKTMKEVAAELNISTRTAESYKYHLMDALSIRTNAELVQYAVKIGLITLKPLDSAA